MVRAPANPTGLRCRSASSFARVLASKACLLRFIKSSATDAPAPPGKGLSPLASCLKREKEFFGGNAPALLLSSVWGWAQMPLFLMLWIACCDPQHEKKEPGLLSLEGRLADVGPALRVPAEQVYAERGRAVIVAVVVVVDEQDAINIVHDRLA